MVSPEDHPADPLYTERADSYLGYRTAALSDAGAAGYQVSPLSLTSRLEGNQNGLNYTAKKLIPGT